jgi:hypothetical protein
MSRQALLSFNQISLMKENTMRNIIALHNGKTKIARNRFGGDTASNETRHRRNANERDVRRLQQAERRMIADELSEIAKHQGSLSGYLVEQQGLPNVPMVRRHIEDATDRFGITEIIAGLHDVVQRGREDIRFRITTGRRRNRGCDRVSLKVDHNTGRILSAHAY